jgi:hypothetical protein
MNPTTFDKKKVTTYVNKITHDTDKNGAIMPFRIAHHSGDSYVEFTNKEKLEICTLFILDCNNAIFSDVYDVRDFPVLLKDAVKHEERLLSVKLRNELYVKLRKEDNIAPTVPSDAKPDEFQNAFLKFIAQRDSDLVIERAPLQLDVEGFGGMNDDADFTEYSDYKTVFDKNNLVASQTYNVKAPTSASTNFENAFARYKAELQNPVSLGLSSSEAAAAEQFNLAMAEKQQLYESEKQKYSDKIQGDLVDDIMQKRMNEIPRVQYNEEAMKEIRREETENERWKEERERLQQIINNTNSQ